MRYAGVPEEPTREMAKRGAAMIWDTLQASGHPERECNGGKFSDFELPAVECYRAMIRAFAASES